VSKSDRFFYGKEEKLKSRKTIESLFGKGKSFSCYPIKIIWLPECKDAVLQSAVGASSRHFKKAVDRNRIKRLLREAYRLQKNDLASCLQNNEQVMSVFFLYVGKELPVYDLVFKKMGDAIERLIQLSIGAAQKNNGESQSE
jgi:ribonuclease P protein component